MRLYRFDRLEHLVRMMEVGIVYFSHPSIWNDRYESNFLSAGHIASGALVLGPDGKYHGALPRRPDSVIASVKFVNPFGQCVFAQCFTTWPETERMWLSARLDRDDSENGKSRRLPTKLRWAVQASAYVSAVRASAGNRAMELVEVEYRPECDVDSRRREFVEKYRNPSRIAELDVWSRDVIEQLKLKRQGAFDDERERRLVLVDTELLRARRHSSSPPPPIPDRKHFVLPVQLRDLVLEVLLAPDTIATDMAYAELLLRSAGFRGPIGRSSLYSAPDYSTVTEKPIEWP